MSTVRVLRFEQYVESPLIKIEGMNLEFLHENFTYCINLFTKHIEATFNFVVWHQSTLLLVYVK